MSRRRTKSSTSRTFRGAAISLADIRRNSRQIAERFHPDKIILFGSYVYGTPHADSDVDLMVIMPARNELDQAIKISWQLPAPFAMDLLVRTPKHLAGWLGERQSFHTEIVTKGKVLYAKFGSSHRVQVGERESPVP